MEKEKLKAPDSNSLMFSVRLPNSSFLSRSRNHSNLVISFLLHNENSGVNEGVMTAVKMSSVLARTPDCFHLVTGDHW